MEHTFFEAPEYPVLDKFKKCAVLFVKQSIALLLVLLLVRIAEMIYSTQIFSVNEGSLLILVEGVLYTTIYFLKAMPILFLFYLVFFFSNMGEMALNIANYIIFAALILVEILLSSYFLSTKSLIDQQLFSNFHRYMHIIFTFNWYWVLTAVVALVLLWFGMRAAKRIKFVDSINALAALSIGLLLMLFGISALPSDDGTLNFKMKVPKSAYLMDKIYTDLFDKEPVVDIYDQNYFD